MNVLNLLRQLEFQDTYEAMLQVCRRHLAEIF